MDLNVSALAAACLIEELRRHDGVSRVVDDRLDDVNRDGAWLDELADFYRQRWEEDKAAAGTSAPTSGATFGHPLVPDDFSLLLSWCLAPCSRDSSLPSPASIQAGPRVQTTVGPLGGNWSDPSVRLGLYAWTVGRGVSALNARFPAALPLDELNDQVPVPVYDGLVQYVEKAGAEPWHEMTTSAVLWRLGALGQAVAHKSLGDSVEALIALSVAASAKPTSITGNWKGRFTGARNGFTHVHADVPGDLCFADAAELHPDAETVFDHLELATIAMSRLANTALLSVPAGRAESWANFLDEARAWM